MTHLKQLWKKRMKNNSELNGIRTHDFCDHATIVDRARNFHERLFLEAWYSQRDDNAGNEHIDIPDVYDSLA